MDGPSAARIASLKEELRHLTKAERLELLTRLQKAAAKPETPRNRIAPRPRPCVEIADAGKLSDGEVVQALRRVLQVATADARARIEQHSRAMSVDQRRTLLGGLQERLLRGLRWARLSYCQQRCFFMQSFNEGNGSLNIAAAVNAYGSLNLQLLETCINQVVERHEILRTNFILGERGPIQIIRPARHIQLEQHDFASVEPADRPRAVQKMLYEQAYRPFQLGAGPLLRLVSLKVSDNEQLLLLTLHHIIADEWSVGVLIKELGGLYASGGDASVLAPLPIQYADYAEWQNEVMTPARLRNQLDYWQAQLAGAPLCLEVPVDHPRPEVATTNGALLSLPIENRIWKGMVEIARREQSTLFMAMLAAFALLLRTYTGRDDLLIGTDFANRDRTETTPLIGFMVNELVLRVRLHASATYLELLRQVRETAVNAFRMADLPFQALVETLNPVRDPSRTPIFQVIFDLHNVPMVLRFKDITLTPVMLRVRPAKYDLTLFLSESADSIHASLEYNTDLYDPGTAERILADYQRLIARIVDDPAASCEALPRPGG